MATIVSNMLSTDSDMLSGPEMMVRVTTVESNLDNGGGTFNGDMGR